MHVHFRQLGLKDYEPVWRDMREFTLARDEHTSDEIWSVQHPPVYTRGQRDRDSEPATPGIPVVDIDRGGLMTYHGPGQAVLYLLLDLKRLGIGIRSLVRALEQSVIALGEEQGFVAARRDDQPGVYVANQKLASLGLRVRNARTYHGIALNVDMDLEPFSHIVPCGIDDISMTQLKDLGCDLDVDAAALRLGELLGEELGFTLTS